MFSVLHLKKLITMKTIYLSLATISLSFLVACGAKEEKKEDKSEDKKTEEPAEETEEVTEEPAAPLDSAAAMQAWMDYMTPSDMHAMIASHDGTWNEEITMWMAPDAPPTKSKGTAVNKMIMGGRYQESIFTGDFGGMPFEGKSTLAYDNATKKFKSTWLDNMGTGIMVMEGEYDASTKTINFVGSTIDPTTGKESKVRETFTFIDENTQKMEMYSNMMGAEFKNMEITFTRKK